MELIGGIGHGLKLVKPLPIKAGEEVHGGWFCATEDVFHNYGEGETLEAAIDDLKATLAEFYELADPAWMDYPGQLELLRSYIQLEANAKA